MPADDVAARIAAAAGSGMALRIAGAGRWLVAGRPVGAATTLSMAADRGIVEYVPGDLTLTARAGTPLTELVAAVKGNGQWLPLDPWGGDDGTLGATISTATAGPHAYAMGLPRDVVLGLEFVTGAGEVVRSGGRVVKNVAGFDLTRLLVGSWGTLGVITEATVRLRARPAALRTFALGLAEDGAALGRLATTLRALPFTPMASEVLNARLAEAVGLPAAIALLVRLGGNERAVSAQVDALRPLGVMTDAPADVWERLRTVTRGAAGAWRWSDLPSRFGDTWMAARDGGRDLEHVAMHGNPLRGIVRVAAQGRPRALATAAIARGHGLAIETLPRDAWAVVPPPEPSAIARKVRAKFDPRCVLNPGILGDAP